MQFANKLFQVPSVSSVQPRDFSESELKIGPPKHLSMLPPSGHLRAFEKQLKYEAYGMLNNASVQNDYYQVQGNIIRMGQ